MTLLIKAVKIIDPGSPHNGKTMDILVENGIISSIKKSIEKKVKNVKHNSLHISPGWFDMRANFRDPGYEHQETLETGAAAAARGGFTGVMLMPSTNPAIDSKAGIDYIKNKSKNFLTDVFPAGTVSKELKGKELSEMFDMHNAGAIAFTDDKKSVQDPNLLKTALLYAKGFNGLVINFPNDKTIARNGVMNEGNTSTELGLKGIPSLAEELMVARDLFLAAYCNARIHFAAISTGKAVELIKKAKKEGLQVTAEVASHQLFLDESALKGFDSNYKLLPPLRTKEDIKALISGLKEGAIDVICSDHSPEDEETKKREFDDAAFGIIGLETCFAAAHTALRKILSLEEIIHKISVNPRKILGLKIPVIKEGEEANFTLFDPQAEWTFSPDHLRSKSKNTPFTGTRFTGKAVAVYNKRKWKEC